MPVPSVIIITAEKRIVKPPRGLFYFWFIFSRIVFVINTVFAENGSVNDMGQTADRE